MIMKPHTFCLFIGHARTGSSAVGSIVDAHPNALISHELGILLRLKHKNLVKDKAFKKMIVSNNRLNDKGRWSEGATGEIYRHKIAGQRKNNDSIIYVIGDKKAGGNSRGLSSRPRTYLRARRERIKRVISRLEDRMETECKFIHVIRNPYDIVAAQILSNENFNFQTIYNEAFTCKLVKNLYPDRWLDVYHEDLIKEPALNVSKLTSFLGLEEDANHLKASIEYLNFSPTNRKDQIKWEDELKIKIQKKLIGRFSCFNRYAS